MSGRMVRRTLRWTTRLATALLVVLALLVVAGRSLVADIGRFHAPLEQWLSERIGATVRFDNVSGEWLRTSPELFLYNVRIAGEDGDNSTAMHIGRLALRLNIARSLQHMTPRLRLRVQGLQASAHCEDMRCRINGLAPGAADHASSGRSGQAPSLVALVAARPQITLSDSRLQVDGLYDRLTEVRMPSVKVWWEAGTGWVSGRVTVSGPDQLDLMLSGRVEPEDSGRFQALLHWRMTQTDLMSWVPPVVRSSMPVQAAGGRGTTLAWLRLDQRGIVSATADIDWHDVSLRSEPGAEVALQDVGGQWRWMRSDNGHWTLAARQLKLMGEGFSWRPSSVFLETSAAADIRRYRLRMADVRIQGSFRSLLEGLGRHHPARQWLLGLQPVGRIQDLDVKVEKGPDGWRWRSGRASLRDVTWQAWQQVPGMSGISATLWLEPTAVWASLDTRDAVLDYPAMMRSPILLRHLRGNLGVDWSTPDIRVSTGVIEAATNDLSAATRLHVRIPRGAPDDPGQLTLQVTLRDGDASQVSRYLPAGLISPPLLAWLDGAIRGGVLEQGDILVNGASRKTPEPLDTSVMLGFRVRDASLQFLPDWEQPVEGLRGDVIVDNGAVMATVQEGRYFGLQLRDGKVMTHRLSPAEPLHVAVQVEGEGDAAGAVPILRDTPLGKVLRAPLTGLSSEGLLTARLDLDAPLQAGAGLKGKVDVSLPSGKLSWPAYRLQLDNLRLDLTYGMDGSFVTRALQADFLGRTVRGEIVTRNASRQRFTRLAVRGSTRMDDLGAWLNLPVTSIVSGEAPWRLDADFYPSRASRPSVIGFHSELDGIKVDLPPPFGKVASGKQPLSLSWSLAHADAVHTFRYGRELSARWSMAGGQISRLGVRLGSGEANLPATGRVIAGYLSRIDTGEWTQVFDRWATKGGAKGTPGALAAWVGSRVSIGDLAAGSFAAGALVVGLEGSADTLSLVLSGERLKGRITAPLSWLESPSSRGNAVPVDLHVEHLVLPPRAVPSDAPPSDASSLASRDASVLDAEPPVTFDPVLLPRARVRIDALRLGSEAFGRYALDLVPEPEGVRLDNVNFELKTIQFKGAGHWRSDAGKTRTTLVGTGTVVNVADVMSGFGYAPSMSSRSGQVVADVGWSGAPWQFAVHRTNGSLKANLVEGRFLTVDNDAARRVWGFLNFKTWMRRMQLEFDDLSSNEMTYNKVSGRFLLGQNQLSVETLRIESPSIDMKMQGEMDLGARELDMVWFVTIPVTRNLMLPAVVVGGLPGAATAFVVDKVLGKQIDRLTTLTYDVKGSFDAPLMEVRAPL